jgi:hypothetical protein
MNNTTPPAPGGSSSGGGEAPARPVTDGVAIAAFVTGILSLLCSLVCLGVLLGPAAAIMGFTSRRRLASGAGGRTGGGLALTGLLLGILGFLVSVTWLVLLLTDASFQQFLKAP